MTDRIKAILNQYNYGLHDLLGEALDRVLLYGSWARDEGRNEDSDIDVLCVMRDGFDYGQLIAQTSALTSEVSLEHGVVLSRAFVRREDFERQQSPFMMNVRREALSL